VTPEPHQPFAFALDAEAAQLAANPSAATPTEVIEATGGLHQLFGSRDPAITVLPTGGVVLWARHRSAEAVARLGSSGRNAAPRGFSLPISAGRGLGRGRRLTAIRAASGDDYGTLADA
jgi:hypothetical protein